MPQDQIFDPEDLDFDPKSQIIQQQKNHDKAKKQIKKERAEESEIVELSANESQKSSDESMANTSYIDNPYLAATKLPAGQSMDTSWGYA